MKNFINSSSFDIALLDASSVRINTEPALPQDYKLYTDNTGIYLYVRYISPSGLLDIQKVNGLKEVELLFLSEDGLPVSKYKAKCSGFSLEFEGTKTETNILTWDLILALEINTIETTNNIKI